MRTLRWLGNIESPEGQHAAIDEPLRQVVQAGEVAVTHFQIRRAADGTWGLIVWKGLARSAKIGTFSSPEVAKQCAAVAHLDDASVLRMAGAPLALSVRFRESQEPS